VTEGKIADSSSTNPYKTKMMLRQKGFHSGDYEEDCVLGCSSVGIQYIFFISSATTIMNVKCKEKVKLSRCLTN
jgi:hypothetical protein